MASGKLSKSDMSQDKESTEAGRAGIEKILNTKSHHFQPYTFVVYKRRRWVICSILERSRKVILWNEDYSECLVLTNPYFMR